MTINSFFGVQFTRSGWKQFCQANRSLGSRFIRAFILKHELAVYLSAHEAAGIRMDTDCQEIRYDDGIYLLLRKMQGEWYITDVMESLAKKIVQEKAKTTDGIAGELLNLRLELSKTSVKKYEAMARTVCRDAPDFLEFDKSLYLSFFPKATVRGNTVEYVTNFGVKLVSTRVDRTLPAFLGFRKCAEDGTVDLLTHGWQVNGRSIQYNCKERNGRKKAVTEEAV